MAGQFLQGNTLDLLTLHAEVMDELRSRDILRSGNNPTGDYAEFLFCRAFGWKRQTNSIKAFDALHDETKYQIKGRRLNNFANHSRQLSAIRDLDGFDVLAGVLFDHHYRVLKAALIPREVVRKSATWAKYTSSYKLFLNDAVWNAPGVEDVTAQLKKAETG